MFQQLTSNVRACGFGTDLLLNVVSVATDYYDEDHVAAMRARLRCRMHDDIILRPAKRIIILYSVAICLSLAAAGMALDGLHDRTLIDLNTLKQIWTPIVVLSVCGLVWAFLWRNSCIFRISNAFVSVTSGVVSRTQSRVLRSRIVDFSETTPLLERAIGLSTLSVYSTRLEDEVTLRQLSHRDLRIASERLERMLNRALTA